MLLIFIIGLPIFSIDSNNVFVLIISFRASNINLFLYSMLDITFLIVSIGNGIEKVIDQNSEIPGITAMVCQAPFTREERFDGKSLFVN